MEISQNFEAFSEYINFHRCKNEFFWQRFTCINTFLIQISIFSDRVEKSLSDRLQQATVQLAAAQERERNASEQYRQLSSKTATLESKISSNNKIKSNVEAQLEQNTKHLENLKEELEKNKVLNETVKSTLGKEISELKNETETSRIGKWNIIVSFLDSFAMKSLFFKYGRLSPLI